MRAAFDGVDIVYKGVDILVRRGVVRKRHLHGYTLFLGRKVDHIVYQRFLVGVDILHELAQACFAAECFAAGLAFGVKFAHIRKVQRYPGIKESEVAKTVGKYRIAVDSGGEYAAVGLECHRSTRFGALPYHIDSGGGLAAAVFLGVNLAAPANFGTQICGQRVHTRHAHAMQTARHLV